MSKWVSILDAQSNILVQLSDLPKVTWEVCCNTRVFHTLARALPPFGKWNCFYIPYLCSQKQQKLIPRSIKLFWGLLLFFSVTVKEIWKFNSTRQSIFLHHRGISSWISYGVWNLPANTRNLLSATSPLVLPNCPAALPTPVAPSQQSIWKGLQPQMLIQNTKALGIT